MYEEIAIIDNTEYVCIEFREAQNVRLDVNA